MIRRSFYEELGGFPNWPLFEDVHLLRLARKQTKIVSFPATVMTSAGRFLEPGIIRTQFLNGWYILQYLQGVSPHKLAAQYNYRKNKILKKSCPAMEETLPH